MARIVIRAPRSGLWRTGLNCGRHVVKPNDRLGYIRSAKTDKMLCELMYKGPAGVVVWFLKECEDLRKGRAVVIIETDEPNKTNPRFISVAIDEAE